MRLRLRALKVAALGVVLGCGEYVDPNAPLEGPVYGIRAEGPVQLGATYRITKDTLFPSVTVATQEVGPVSVEWGDCILRTRAYYDEARTELAWIDDRWPGEDGVVWICHAVGFLGEARRGEPAVIDYPIPLRGLRYKLPKGELHFTVVVELNDRLIEVPARRVPNSD